jgi:hypothetical protein
MATPQANLTSDIETLMKMPVKVSKEITDKACLCIGSIINDAKQSGESQVTISIGIGALSVNLLDMQCKFIPSKALKTAIKDALSSETDPLELVLEQSFAEKLLAICEEVL